ncbi:MAG: hypothetical protein UT08_C0023G0002 [Candidatus Woesebacteria bacterium GW2011_GWB1_38_8]|uniref:Uncharacterized protein n=1 Tax=Candidatus Woesebacteria bacterium GW2011_GWB1_38_8 TaxID=1618570 RepID=A0A0G0KZI8_9BACT|nr:MAG: hypothetical protein UT08_C0023G0002 [Candidatus Woesebacteria bacterium GW2011_GWB1_38_8]
MILVKTKIGPSKINGIGLFANQFIPKGTLVQNVNNFLNMLIKIGMGIISFVLTILVFLIIQIAQI